MTNEINRSSPKTEHPLPPGSGPPGPQGPQVGPDSRIGRFVLKAKLGEGGCGVVYRAWQDSPIGRSVVVKLPRTEFATRERREQFLDGARCLARLNHPSVVKLLEVGYWDLRPYIVMEDVEGVPIQAYCDQKKLGVTERVELMIQACDAVQHIHERDVIHRDLTPANVLVVNGSNDRPVVKVIDFGLARSLGLDPPPREPSPAGTDGYVAPEVRQDNSEGLRPTVDVYSLGALLKTLLDGHVPRNDSDLGWILQKAMNEEPEKRYQNAAALGADLRSYLRCQPLPSRKNSWWTRAWKFARRNPRPLLAGTAALCLCAVLGLATSFGRSAYVALKEEHDDLARKIDKLDSDRGYMQKDYVALQKSSWSSEAEVYAGRMRSVEQLIGRSELAAARRELSDCRREQRDWEWRVLSGQVDQSRTLMGRSVAGFTKAFHDEVGGGSIVRAGSIDGSIWGWDAKEKEFEFKFKFTRKYHSAPVLDLSVVGSPQHYAISVAADGSICLWNAQTGKFISSNTKALEKLLSVPSVKSWGAPYHAQHIAALSPRSDWLCWLGNREGRLFRLRVGAAQSLEVTEQAQLMLDKAQPFRWGEDEDAWAVWDSSSEAHRLFTVRRLKSSEGKPKGELITWEVPAGVPSSAPIPFLALPTQSPLRVTKNRMLVGVGKRPIMLDLDVLLREKRTAGWALREHGDEVTALAISDSRELVATGGGLQDKMIWRLRTQQVDSPEAKPDTLLEGDQMRGHESAITSLKFCRTGASLISTSLDGTIRIWDVDHPPTTLIVPAEQSGIKTDSARRRVVSVRFSRGRGSATLVASTLLPAVNAWDLGEKNAVLGVTGHDSQDPWLAVGEIGVTEDGRLVAASVKTNSDRHLLLAWPLQPQLGPFPKPAVHLELGAGKAFARPIAVHPLGTYLAGAGIETGPVLLWRKDESDTYKYSPVQSSLPEAKAQVVSLDFSPDGELLAAACEDGRLLVWDVKSGQTTSWPQPFRPGTLTSVRFGSNSREIGLASSNGVIHICDLKKDQNGVEPGSVVTHPAHEGQFVNRMVFRPGAHHSRFGTATIEGLKIWDSYSRPFVELLHYEGPAFDTDWDASGDTLAAAGVPDQVVLLRDLSPEVYHDQRALAYSLLMRHRWSETVRNQVLPDLESQSDAPPESVCKGAARLLDAFGDDPAAMATEALALLSTLERERSTEALRLARLAHAAWVKEFPLPDEDPLRPDLGNILMILGATLYRDQVNGTRRDNRAQSAFELENLTKEQSDAVKEAVQALILARKQLKQGSTDDLRALAYLAMAQALLPNAEAANRSFEEYETLLREQNVQNSEFKSLRREVGLAVLKEHRP